ncbi:MAG: hypothetical protein JNJ45_04155 [Chthonomonas sp.]|nr:hypothetical protein [Chthonomonas sp.]
MTQPVDREHSIMRFVIRFGIAITLIALLPAMIGFTSGRPYLGVQTNTDDHMVYAAWMRQAAEGRFLFENRFTTDPQSGQFFHVYFLILGWVSALVGPMVATTLARGFFCLLFFWLLGKLFTRSEVSIYASKLAIALIGVGGGLGFLVWHNFGQAIVKPVPSALARPMLSRLPTDVWQTEGFVFPSMLSNGLFMASLCLILGFFWSVVEARTNKRAVWPGLVCIGLLMNIHSYDVLLVGLVMLGFLVTTVRSGTFSSGWLGRVATMTLGVVPAALWFVHVLRADAVFQARAATPTYSPNFRQYFFGYLPGVGVGLAGAWRSARVGVLLVAGLMLAGFGFAASHVFDGYWMGPLAFALVAALGLVVCWFLAGECQLTNLLSAWMVMGFIAPYWPALFQRKLTMGLAVPVAALAAIGIARLIENRNRSSRNMATILGCLVMSGSSLLWLAREFQLQGQNVSNTTVQPVFLGTDEAAIVRILSNASGKKVVLSLPGVPAQGEVPDQFLSPVVPDLNPILVGLAGCTSPIGHWSETPNYLERRGKVTKDVFLNADPAARASNLATLGVDYLVWPDSKTFGTPEQAGTVLYDGEKFDLIDVRNLPK